MKLIYECEWCSFRSTIDVVENHERHCKYNPKNIEIKEKLNWIAEHCKYRKECWDEYDEFWGCVKNEPYGYGGRHTPGCCPNFDCLQYCEGEDLWGKNVNPFSFKRDIFGQIEEPEYTIDKISSFTLYYKRCPSCNFNNQFENMEVCPFCGQNLVLMKEDNYETAN